MTEVTRILSAIEDGDPHAAEQLLPPVYDKLCKLTAYADFTPVVVRVIPAKGLRSEAFIQHRIDSDSVRKSIVSPD